jgi:hypothetical protein
MRKEILTTMFIVLFISGFSAQGQEKTQPETGRPAVTPLRKLQLPEPKLTGSVSLEQAMAVRRSVRQFTSQELNLEQVGQLAWAGQGITQKERGYRTAPSAGALYPIRLYFIIKGGMYVYEPNDHSLELGEESCSQVRPKGPPIYAFGSRAHRPEYSPPGGQFGISLGANRRLR